MLVEKRLKDILAIKDLREQDKTLRAFAESLGCSVDATYRTVDNVPIHDTNEVIRRIREAARSQREEKLWIAAVASAIASVVSALAAWCAVLKK